MNNTIEIIKLTFASFTATLPELFFMICGLVFTLTMINGLIILPLIFSLNIIPKIKKRVRQELEYHSFLKSRILFWKFLWPYMEISKYIFLKYLTKKTKINFDKLIPADFALKKVNYNINQSSRFEIVMSFIVVINSLLSLISPIIILLIGHFYNIQ